MICVSKSVIFENNMYVVFKEYGTFSKQKLKQNEKGNVYPIATAYSTMQKSIFNSKAS